MSYDECVLCAICGHSVFEFKSILMDANATKVVIKGL